MWDVAELMSNLYKNALRIFARQVAERRQIVAPGERVPTYRDNPGITFPKESKRAKRATESLRPYRAQDSFLLDPGVASRYIGLIPGYYLQPLRG